MGFHFAFELVGNFVYLLCFVNESCYCLTLDDALFVMFVCFMYMVRKDMFDRKGLAGQYSNYCFADLY